MSIVALSETPILSFLNNAGQLNAGGSLLTQVGGVNYPTYQDPNGSTPLPNPIPLNSRGEISNAAGTSCQLFLVSGVTYSFTLFDANGNQLNQAPDVMAIAPVAVGNMTDEKGSGGQVGFVAGVDFTAGTSTTLTLSQNYGSASNLWVAFDAGEQGGDTFSLSGTNNETLTFNAPIPLGTQKVYVKGGTSLTVGTPGIGTVTDSNVAANAGINSSKLAYIAPYTAAVSRTVLSKLGDIVSIADFGGSPSATAAVNTAAATAAHAIGLPVYYPPGTWNLNPFSIAAGGIVGLGQSSTILNFADTSSSDLITFTGTGSTTPALFRDFTIQASLTKTTGYGLRFNAASGQLQFPNITNVQTLDVPGGIFFSNTSQFVIDQCNFINYRTAGVHIENSNVSDSGDSCISNCFFNTSVPTGSTYGIWHRSGGGLKLISTKILGGNSCYVMGWIGTSNGAADLSIIGCSLENATNYAVFLGRDSGTAALGSVMITGSETGCASGIVTDNSGFLTLVAIAGNVINVEGTLNTNYGIALNNVGNIALGPNVINAQNSGSPVGVTIQGSSTGKGSPQVFSNFAAGSRVSNGAAGFVYEEASQTGGIGNVTTSSGYGSLYSGSVAVTFPIPFAVAPSAVLINVQSTNGAICGIATNITTGGFTAEIIGVTNGGVTSGATYSTQGGVI